MDRQQIERRDFPIVRRGYDPASVDAHLRALAGEIEELAGRAGSSGGESLAAVAGSQVQGILEAAQATAETIEREAVQDAQNMRAAATDDARRTREDAIAKAREHVAAVSQATEELLARVGSMDAETQTLIESLRSGATRLAGDLTTVEVNMEALYDAASGRGGAAHARAAQTVLQPQQPVAAAQAIAVPQSREPAGRDEVAQETAISPPPPPVERRPSAEAPSEPRAAQQPREAPSSLAGKIEEKPSTSSENGGEDLDGPRLVALNMALNGDSREVTGRYIEENFEVADRERLLDEVYAAIEG